jgi:Tfp pilus assembly protein PilX
MTRLKLRSQDGSALVTALLVMMIMMTLGIAMLGLVDSQQRESGKERQRESTFQLTEAVLNAQIYQLSNRWPSCSTTTVCDASVKYPPSCTQVSTQNDCPKPATLNGAFNTTDYKSGATWTTQIRDDDSAKPDFYSDSLLSGATYDANDDGYVWARATSVLNGHRRTLVALVKAEKTTVNFPRHTMVAGWFTTTNNGNKVIIDNSGGFSPPSEAVVRCAAAGTTPPVAGCADYQAGKGQLSPERVTFDPNQPSAVTPEALDSLRAAALADGNYYAVGSCPASLQGNQPGETVFIEDAASCPIYNGNSDYNTLAKPGWVIIGKGQIKINGTATFYGVIYHANLDNVSSPARVSLGGNVSINGSIVVDGVGGIDAGSSKVNIVWNPNVFNNLTAFGTAGIVQNTFREISATS